MAPHLFRACEEHGVEGIVLKRRDSLYRPGQRCPQWCKVKSALWFERHAEHRRPR
jgi:ATP-dependent DNA ligase